MAFLQVKNEESVIALSTAWPSERFNVKRIYHVLVSEGFHGTETFPLDGNT